MYVGFSAEAQATAKAKMARALICIMMVRSYSRKLRGNLKTHTLLLHVLFLFFLITTYSTSGRLVYSAAARAGVWLLAAGWLLQLVEPVPQGGVAHCEGCSSSAVAGPAYRIQLAHYELLVHKLCCSCGERVVHDHLEAITSRTNHGSSSGCSGSCWSGLVAAPVQEERVGVISAVSTHERTASV
jgi:hypothetical protein